MTYSEKLKNPKWQRKRLEVLQRDDFTCKYCGDKETELHVHHTKYVGEPHEAPDEYLETVCKDCHYILELFKKALPDITIIKTIKFNNSISNDIKLMCIKDSNNTVGFIGFDDSKMIYLWSLGMKGINKIKEFLNNE